MAVEFSNDDLLKEQVGRYAKVIVKYYADWCGSCKLFSSKYQRLSNDTSFSHITFIALNAEGNPESRKMAGVYTLPFFATFRNGQLQKAISTTGENDVIKMLHEL